MKNFLKPKLIFALVVVSMLFGLAAILSMKVPVMARTSCGQVLVKASGWLGGHGIDVRSNGADMRTKYACDPDGEVYNLSANPPQYGFGWLSVELVNRLYVTKGWSARLIIPATYNGKATNSGAKWLYTLATAGYYPDLVAHANGSNYKPVPGDMIVHSNGTLGHVTVVDHISGNTLYAVDQNRSANGWESYAYNSSTGAVSMSGVTISGYVHSTHNRSIVHVSGTLPTNETWTSNNIYVVDSQLTIPNGITLTIDPGTIVKVASSGLDVQNGGTLNATGTSTSPIIFTSYEDDSVGGDTNGDGNATTAGNYDYNTAIQNDSGGTADVAFADIRYGTYAFFANCNGSTDSNMTLTDNQIENEVQLSYCPSQTGSYAIKRNHFAVTTGSNGFYPINVLAGDPSVIQLSGADKNTFTGSGANDTIAIGENGGSCNTVAAGKTWTVDSGPVLLLNSDCGLSDGALNIAGTVNLNPGVIVKTGGEIGFDIQDGGTLNVAGSATNPVIFTSYKDDSAGGDSNGDGSATTSATGDYETAIQNESGGTAEISYADIRDGTYSFFANCGGTTDSNMSLTDNQFEDVVQLNYCPLQTGTYVMKRNHFDFATSVSSPGRYPLTVFSSDPSVIQLSGDDKNTFTGTGVSRTIALDEQSGCNTVASGETWTVDAGLVLLLNDNCGVSGGALNVAGTVNLNPGVIVKTGGEIGFDIQDGGALNVAGSSSNPVILTSYKDDTAGGDSNGDGDTTTPGTNDYSSVVVVAYGTTNATVNINHADIRYGSEPLILDNGEADIEGTTMSYPQRGMYIAGDAEANIEGTTISHADTGIYVADNAKVVYRGSFSDIADKAIKACNWEVTNGCTVDAAYVNWGSADGPLASNPDNNMACGAVTFSPWSYGSSTYTMTVNPDVYAVRNCDNSVDTPSDELSAAISHFQSAISLKEIDCSGDYQPACDDIVTARACISGAVETAASTSPWPLPGASTADEVNVFDSRIRGAAATYITGQEELSVTGLSTVIASKVVSLTGTFLTMRDAYNSCAP